MYQFMKIFERISAEQLDVQRTRLLAFKRWRIWYCGKSAKQLATTQCMYV